MKSKLCLLGLSLTLGLIWTSLVTAQGPMPKPGPEHEWLKKFEGEWDCTVKMTGSESQAKSVSKMELGGFYLCQTFEGDFGGMKFTGRATNSYCPIRKKYISTWIDSMSPSMMIMEGVVSNNGKTFTETGKGPSMTGEMTSFKSVSEFKDDNTIHFTMYEVKDGKENEMMTIIYKRKK